MGSYRAIAEYYDAEYESYGMLREDVPFLLSKMPRRGVRVLELAVGTGRAAVEMAQAGHRVVGVDYDERVLEIARRKREGLGVEAGRMRLVAGDMLTMRLKDRFDWAVLLFNTFLVFTTLDQQDAALANMARHLRPGGRLWIDVPQPNVDLLSAGSVRGMDPLTFHVAELGRTVMRTLDVEADPVRQVQRMAFVYQWFDAKGVAKSRRVEFELAVVFPREMRLLLERTGFEVEKEFGDHDGSRVSGHSPRLIVQARKKR